MQIICTLLQTDNNASTSFIFLQARCCSGCQTNSVKALKVIVLNRCNSDNDGNSTRHSNDISNRAITAAAVTSSGSAWENFVQVSSNDLRDLAKQRVAAEKKAY